MTLKGRGHTSFSECLYLEDVRQRKIISLTAWLGGTAVSTSGYYIMTKVGSRPTGIDEGCDGAWHVSVVIGSLCCDE